MNLLLPFAAQCVHIALVVLTAPTVAGALDWTEARLAGRTGVSWFAPWQELARLRHKQPVLAQSASPLSGAAPLVCFGALALAATLVPSFTLGMSFAPFADLLVIAGLLALARTVLALAALDDGTAGGAIAACQSMVLALGGEAALLLVVLALGLAAGGTNLDLIVGAAQAGLMHPSAAIAIAVSALAVLAVVQRDVGMPEAACFSASGLALLRLAEALRLLLWIDLIGAVLVPFGMASAGDFPVGWGIGLVTWAGRLALALGLLAGLRTAAGRFSWRRIPVLLMLALLLASFAGLLALTRAGPV